jgi:3-hydroxyacyl-CoA dehydrogenase/enoyl-CoA hydratase/3-hydroxybutyryl-CoA epimerase/enoyl-CoA isomerase
MMYRGTAIHAQLLENGIAELVFDATAGSVNKFDDLTLGELKAAAEALASHDGVKGLLVTSAKDAFIVGADITEFNRKFSHGEEEIANAIVETNRIFNAIEDLPFPSVTAINGYALGGGFEMALATDYRVMSSKAKIGCPEVQLGIIPGFGGTVRLPRIIGADNAVEWIAGGKQQDAETSLSAGAVDAVVEPEQVRDAAMDLLQRCIDGDFDYRAKRQEKLEPMQLNDIESLMSFTTAQAYVASQAGRHYPAPVTAVDTIRDHSKLVRDEALEVEARSFAKLARTDVAGNLVHLFLADQTLGKIAKGWAEKARPVQKSAVLGAGIMGGGIAYQSAYKGIPIVMKDIEQAGIDLGLSEATKLLSKRVARGRMTPEKMASVLNLINPTMGYGDFEGVDFVVEAVVENLKVKHVVLPEVEAQIGPDAVLASNTSTISIDLLAEPLARPESFCGMHFFNPVQRMPLVEIIRGSKTSDAAIGRAVGYALALGKKPVVVRDCPGFLVNRIIFPYMFGFARLLHDGADFVQVDKAMAKFGWPMGPAHLSDVVGIDTGVHAGRVMSESYPDRMSYEFKSAGEILFENDRLGQKNGKGYYSYAPDKKGRPQKTQDPEVEALLAPHVEARREFEEGEIVERMMVPMCIEAVRCLEDGIVDSPTEVDAALIFGLGFPPFRGGALRYLDTIGAGAFCELAEKYAALGPLYATPEKLRAMARSDEKFFA